MVAVPPLRVSTWEMTASLTAGTVVVPPLEVTYETVPVVGADGEETNDEVGTVYPDWVMTGVDHAGGAV
jgi:hypothetical protein